MTRPLMKALSAYMVVLFLQYDKKYRLFSGFSLMGSMIGAFYPLFLLNFKKEGINRFP